jgi:hypothetical protein
MHFYHLISKQPKKTIKKKIIYIGDFKIPEIKIASLNILFGVVDKVEYNNDNQ